MQKIIPHLWYDKEAVEAAEFYANSFPHSKIVHKSTIYNTPSGTCDLVTVSLLGYEFMFISAGPLFKLNPSVSFIVICQSKQEVDSLWEKLAEGGTTMMERGEYSFSKWYGWIQDKFGVSWQLMLMTEGLEDQTIIPTMMFVGDAYGKAAEAAKFYVSVFKDNPFYSGESKVGEVFRYTEDEKPDKEGTVKHLSFTLAGQRFAAMDSARSHDFTFNEAISFLVSCDSQEEIDYFWNKLSADPTAEQCGWLKDKYGFSWQIYPKILEKMMMDKDQSKVDRVTQAFLPMKKFDINALEKAYTNKT